MIDNLPPNHMIGPEWGQLELPAPTRALGFAAVWLCDLVRRWPLWASMHTPMKCE